MLQNELAARWFKTFKRLKDGYAIETIDIEHQKVHEGAFFTANLLLTAVANDGFARLKVTTDSTTEMHVTITLISEGKAYFKTRSAGTSSGGTAPDGVKLTVFNRNPGHAIASGVTVVHTPTITVEGALRGNQLLNGGTGGTSIGTQSGSRIETVIDPLTTFITELQNKKGNASDLCIILDWYEVKE
jgi:hypothetical protein